MNHGSISKVNVDGDRGSDYFGHTTPTQISDRVIPKLYDAKQDTRVAQSSLGNDPDLQQRTRIEEVCITILLGAFDCRKAVSGLRPSGESGAHRQRDHAGDDAPPVILTTVTFSPRLTAGTITS